MSAAVPIRLGAAGIEEDADGDYFWPGEKIVPLTRADGSGRVERDLRYARRDPARGNPTGFRTLTWVEFTGECAGIFGPHWRAELVARHVVDAVRIDRWEAAGRTSDPMITQLLMACVACRQSGVPLPV